MERPNPKRIKTKMGYSDKQSADTIDPVLNPNFNLKTGEATQDYMKLSPRGKDKDYGENANTFNNPQSNATGIFQIIPSKAFFEVQRVINKTDLAPHVEVDLDQMKKDVEVARNGLPYVFGDMKKNSGIEKISEFIISHGGL